MSEIQLFIFVSVFVYLVITSILDIKYRFVYDYLTFGFGAAFVVLRLLFAFENGDFYLFYGFLPYFVGALIISFLLYKIGHWGGGDLKLLLVLSIAIPFFPDDQALPFFVNFLANTLIGGLVYGIVYSLILMVAKIKKLRNVYSLFDSLITFSTLVVCVILFIKLNAFGRMMSVLIALLPIVYLIKKAEGPIFTIEKKSMDLEPGDWILKDIKVGKNIVRKKPTGLSKKDILLLQKSRKHKTVLIRDGLPFVPSFLIGFLLAVFYGNIFLGLFQLIFANM